MRVLYVTPAYAPAYRIGGPVFTVEGLIGGLRARGVDIRVITSNSEGAGVVDAPLGATAWEGVPVDRVARWMAPDVSPVFRRVVAAARDADVVHLAGFFSLFTLQGVLASVVADKPMVLSPHGTLDPVAMGLRSKGKKAAWVKLSRTLFRRVAMYHATSEMEAEHVRMLLGSDVPVCVVPNGVDDAMCDPAGRVAEPEVPRIGILGRIHPKKNIECLLEAGALLARRGRVFEIVIAGTSADPDYPARLMAQAEALGIGSRVSFPGEFHGAAKQAWLSQLRVFAFPSRTENFGNVVVEALACGTPVVASHHTPWDRLDAVGAGRWIAATPEAFAETLDGYLTDGERARAEGERGTAWVRSHFTWTEVGRQMLECYGALTAQRAAA